MASPPRRPRRLASSGTAGAYHLACRLTCAFAPCLERAFPLCRLPHVVAWGWAAVLRPWRAAGPRLAGFGRTGWAGGRRADVPEITADPGGGEPACSGGAFP